MPKNDQPACLEGEGEGEEEEGHEEEEEEGEEEGEKEEEKDEKEEKEDGLIIIRPEVCGSGSECSGETEND